MIKIYGDRYRHPDNARFEAAVEGNLPHLIYDETRTFYKVLVRPFFIDEDLATACKAGVKSAIAKAERNRRALAFLGCNDRFFLLTRLCGRMDADHPWLFDRCRDVEDEPDGNADLWSRFHYKSTIITFAGSIQEVVRDPEIKIAIFSAVKPIARAFLSQIKEELEGNGLLKFVFSDVFYQNPRSIGPDGRPAKWSLARGITVKRESNPKEATIEAHGLIDGQPTSRHYDLHIYDDMVTQDYLSDESIRKTNERWEMADNLGSHLGVRKWLLGTRYHYADTYSVVLERGSMKPRIHPATDTGKLDGEPVFLSKERWEQIKRDQRSTVSAQCLLNPIADTEATFHIDMLRGYDVFPSVMNVYILVDPSKGRTRTSDRTAIAVVGVDQGGVKYLLDGYRHRMKLSDRYAFVANLRRKWEKHPGVQIVKVGWERYGKDAEIEAIEDIQLRNNEVFEIAELNTPYQGGHSKNDRIERLEPDFRLGRFLLPGEIHHPDKGGRCTWAIWDETLDKIAERSGKQRHPIGTIVCTFVGDKLSKRQENCRVTAQSHRIVYPVKRFDENKDVYDLTRVFMDEFLRHPFAVHDDLIDAVARIYDIDPQIPQIFEAQSTEPIADDDYDPYPA
jgi:hypothetical protein